MAPSNWKLLASSLSEARVEGPWNSRPRLSFKHHRPGSGPRRPAPLLHPLAEWLRWGPSVIEEQLRQTHLD